MVTILALKLQEHTSVPTMNVLKPSPMLQMEWIDEFGHHLIFERVRHVFVGQPFSAIPLFHCVNTPFHFYVFFHSCCNINYTEQLFYINGME
jgi:hypothetical protein